MSVWPAESPQWSSVSYAELMKITDIPKITVHQLIENSNKFPIEFPIDSVKCKTLITNTSESVLEKNINSAYPVLHEKALNLYLQFLIHKRKFGTSIEKEMYENMTIEDLIDRILTKRAVAFVGPRDMYMLLDGITGAGKWETVGTPQEEEPLVLKNCLSYDEMKLSALLSVSSNTQFINIGDRNNCGKLELDKDKIEGNGIIIGLIGTRLHRFNAMEHQDILVTQEQNVEENGYGESVLPTVKNLFINFYGEMSLTYKQLKHQLKDETKFTKVKERYFFNNLIYARRLALSIDTLLIEANDRAKLADTMAYLHVVGIGLGVWRILTIQEKMFMDTFFQRIQFLSPALGHMADICFSYIKETSCGKYKNGEIFPIDGHKNGGIRIHIFNREPHAKLSHESEGQLLVVSYAWDGNALPGNEFWFGSLSSSGDPAAACSTQVAELHNPHINPVVCGANLKIATLNGLVTLEEYRKRLRTSTES